MKEEIVYALDSLGVAHETVIEVPSKPFYLFFVEGGLPGMIIITLLLIALLIAAWKAPKWVKEIGLAALVVAILWNMAGLYQAMGAIMMTGDISPAVLCGGLRVAMISSFYGLIVYLISLIIRIIQKPRI